MVVILMEKDKRCQIPGCGARAYKVFDGMDVCCDCWNEMSAMIKNSNGIHS